MSYEWREGYEYQGISPQTIQTLMNAMFDATYPVGSYYETSDTSFNPNNGFVGLWELETEGLVHISSGTNYNVSSNAKDGGNSTINYTPSGSNSGGSVHGYALKVTEIPSHAHTLQINGKSACFWAGYQPGTTRGGVNYNETAAAPLGISSTGGGQAHSHGFTNPTFSGTQATLNVMQPYKIVNRWHRIA